MFSRTEDFPEDWPPRTAIWGRSIGAVPPIIAKLGWGGGGWEGGHVEGG